MENIREQETQGGAPSIVVMSQQAQGKGRYLGFWAAKACWVIDSRSFRTYTSDVDELLAAIVSAISELLLEAFIVNRCCPGPRFQSVAGSPHRSSRSHPRQQSPQWFHVRAVHLGDRLGFCPAPIRLILNGNHRKRNQQDPCLSPRTSLTCNTVNAILQIPDNCVTTSIEWEW